MTTCAIAKEKKQSVSLWQQLTLNDSIHQDHYE